MNKDTEEEPSGWEGLQRKGWQEAGMTPLEISRVGGSCGLFQSHLSSLWRLLSPIKASSTEISHQLCG